MRIPLILTALAALALPTGSGAQVSARVLISSGPISGHVVVGEPYIAYPYSGHVVYRARPRRVVYADRYYVDRGHRVIVVERRHGRGHGHGYAYGRDYRRGGYRRVVLYYDRGRDYYYDRYRPGLVEVEVEVRR